MKKRRFTLFVMLAAIIALSFNACKQEDPAKPLEVNLDKKATIKGTVAVNIFTTYDYATYEPITRSAFSLTASIANADLNLLADGNTGTWSKVFRNEYYNESTSQYEIDVPVGEYPTKVDLVLSDVLIGNYKYYDDEGVVRTGKARFRFEKKTVYLTEGEVMVLERWPYSVTIIEGVGDPI